MTFRQVWKCFLSATGAPVKNITGVRTEDVATLGTAAIMRQTAPDFQRSGHTLRVCARGLCQHVSDDFYRCCSVWSTAGSPCRKKLLAGCWENCWSLFRRRDKRSCKATGCRPKSFVLSKRKQKSAQFVDMISRLIRKYPIGDTKIVMKTQKILFPPRLGVINNDFLLSYTSFVFCVSQKFLWKNCISKTRLRICAKLP